MSFIKVIFFMSIFVNVSCFAGERSLLLDAHLHYRPEHDNFMGIHEEPCEGKGSMMIEGKEIEIECVPDEPEVTYKDFINNKKVRMALLISPSFEIRSVPNLERKNADQWNQDESNVYKMDQRTSEIVNTNPERFIGLCGLNYEWKTEDAIERVSSCLELPGMKGIKMHSFSAWRPDSHLGQEKTQASIDNILSTVKSKKPIILWHIKPCGDESSSTCDTHEINFVFEMAKKYPEISYVIAHSMYDPSTIETLLLFEKQSNTRLTNLFLETSEADPVKMKNAWSQFGFDRILFGSDNVNDDSLRKLKIESVLTPEELNLIENITPMTLFKRATIGFAVDDSNRGTVEKDLGNDHVSKSREYSAVTKR